MHQTPAFHRISKECATTSGACKLSWILPSKLRLLSALELNSIAMYLLVWTVRSCNQQHTEHTCLCVSRSNYLHAGSSSVSKKGNAQKMPVNHFVPSGKSVEIDVVAQQARILFTASMLSPQAPSCCQSACKLCKIPTIQGLAWIEVKAHEPFDLYSGQWLGNPGHYKGMDLLHSSNRSSNSIFALVTQLMLMHRSATTS